MKTRIDFETEKGKFYALRPTQQQTMDAELVYKTKYSEALRYGALTTAEAIRIIEARDLWTDDDKKQVSDLLLEVHNLGNELKKQNSVTKGLELVNEIESKRLDILRVNMKRNAILDNTSESYADEQRLQFYIVECTFRDDGTQLFKDKSELIAASDEHHTVLATKFIIYLISNEGKDFREGWPDYEWRKSHGLVNDHMEPVEELPEDFTQKLEEEKKAAKPKRKKRKTAAKKS
jgi:hypothetical protein